MSTEYLEKELEASESERSYLLDLAARRSAAASKLEREVAELRKDKERLDWLLENVICAYEKSWHPKDTEYLATREEIDEAMGGAR